MKLKNLGYFIYDIGLSPQRKLNNTTSLESLGDKLLKFEHVDEMRNYIDNFSEYQSNFLFSIIDYRN